MVNKNLQYSKFGKPFKYACNWAVPSVPFVCTVLTGSRPVAIADSPRTPGRLAMAAFSELPL